MAPRRFGLQPPVRRWRPPLKRAFSGGSDRMTMNQRTGRRGMGRARRVARSDSRGIRGVTELPRVRAAVARRSGDWLVGPSCRGGRLGGDHLRGQLIARARVTPGRPAIGTRVGQRSRRCGAPIRVPATQQQRRRRAPCEHPPRSNPKSRQRRAMRRRQGQHAHPHHRTGALHSKARGCGAAATFLGRRPHHPRLRPHGCTAELSLAAVVHQLHRAHFIVVRHRHASLRANAARAGDHR
jgi:hypothetical protein